MSEDTFSMHTVEDDAVTHDSTTTITSEVLNPTEPVESGLMRQVWVYDDAKVFVRALKLAANMGLGLFPVCGLCHKAGKTATCQWGTAGASGEYVLACGCTARVMEGIRK